MQQDLLIVQLNVPCNEACGDYYYRAFLPARALASLPGVYVINLTNEHRYRFQLLESADVLIINMVCDPDLLPVIDRRRRAGLLTLYELNDDVFNHSPCNPRKRFWDDPFNRRVLIRLLETVDALQFSTWELQRVYGNPQIPSAVFPNHLGFVPPPRTDGHRRPLVVGWGGSLGHLNDLRVLAGPLTQWLCRRPDVALHLMGASAFRDLFAGVPEDRLVWTPPGSMADYYQFLRCLDIGIAPMLDTPYNRCRSDVKYLEYASHQVAPVVQRARPYLELVEDGKTGLFFDTPDELIAHLERLGSDDAYRIRLASAARTHVCRYRHPERDAQQRIAFYRDLIRSLGCKVLPQSASQRFEHWAALEGGRQYGRCLVLLATEFESQLRMGLALLEEGRPREARLCFQEASRLALESYLPDLYLAACASDPIPFLRKCLAKNPHSLQAARCLSGYRVRSVSTIMRHGSVN